VRFRTVLTAVVAALGLAPGAYAQGCALCYTTASATSNAAQHSLRVGIFTLLIPALALFLGVFFLLYRRAIAASA
jgi:hypothetical protein